MRADLSRVPEITRLMGGHQRQGRIFLIQALRPLLRRGSALVLCGSAASRKVVPGVSAYGAPSKAALEYLGRALAAEFAADGIRVNMVIPGAIDTPTTARTAGVAPEAVEGTKAFLSTLAPMRRIGKPEECAAAVLFLASPEASFITGSQVMVDGGVVGAG